MARFSQRPRTRLQSLNLDWLATDVEEPPYRRIKDGISYADLRKLMLERAAAGE